MPTKSSHKHNNKVLSQVSNNISEEMIKEFALKLYSEIPENELFPIGGNLLAKAATSTFKLFENRRNKDFNVNIFIENKNADYAVLEVISGDVPFLIDSISNALKKHQCEIHLVAHPTIFVNRNATGKVISFEKGEAKELLIQFYFSNSFDDEWYKKLESEIRQVLECVHLAVKDWRKMKAKMLESIDLVKSSHALKSHEMLNESVLFLEWLVDNHFVFLGFVECDIKNKTIIANNHTKLGILKSKLYSFNSIEADEQYFELDPLFIREWDASSVVHRSADLDALVIKKFDNKSNCIGALLFFGLFTSTVYYQSVRNIPLMRKKVDKVIEQYGYPESSHNCKELITAMESFPRDELLQMSIDDLYKTATGIVSLSLIPRIKVFLRKGKTKKFISCLIFLPEGRFSTDIRIMIENILCRHLNGTISKRYLQIGEEALTRLQLIIKSSGNIETIDHQKIEKEIIHSISRWTDQLFEALSAKYSLREASTIVNKYKNAFDIRYRTMFAGKQAVHDIRLIEDAISKEKVCFDIYLSPKTSKQILQLKIYSLDKELPLSSTLPIIENLGLFAIDVLTYTVSAQNKNSPRKVFIYHFHLNTKIQNDNLNSTLLFNIKETLEKIWDQEIDDDNFNSLIVSAGLNWREAAIIRTYAKYFKQTNYQYSAEYTLEALQSNRSIAKKLIELFNLKFTPSTSNASKVIEAKINDIKKDINEIKSIEEDKVIRSYFNVILATKRTNFFQLDENNKHKPYISLKISSQEVDVLPQPKPYAEIFVYSQRFEGIHLRGGKIARGGIRWSDRKEDYRTEVLGLMKAQMTKNSVIVPVGSKGGFIVKKVSPADGREAYLNEGVNCYKTFLSGLLDVTDNIIKGKIIPPKQVARFDDNDPYLVVAADKGTATFSDYANQVSNKYGFWLGDAFASGGSAGYDHKKMGITAKGAWISVKCHFESMGVNIDKQEFTCVGIGDMSGDVFGNGMLLSKRMKLIAAFNHAHIFLDPDPNPEKSFQERLRLFKKPRSQWTDYNLKLISKGGGVFDRRTKSLPISPEMRKALNIQDTMLSPDALIKAILKAPVDLLWNGGIGTYVKAHIETNERIGDKSNDALRVNGTELRCKIIGEGGNLGMTQLGRIEYASMGGRLNTDFIDNSAGVDCSDHEVNIKIAMSDELRSGKLKVKERDTLLALMTDDVAQLVLQDNFKQTQIITIETHSKAPRINAHAWLIKYLEDRKELDRKIEYLPSQEDLGKMISEKKRLTRPEISVILAYAKNSAYNHISTHDLTKEKYLIKYLYRYFPTEFQKKYGKLIEEHKLRSEILATVITNDMVNTLGCTLFHQMLDDTGSTPLDIAKAYIIVKEVFKIDTTWQKIEQLSANVPIEMRVALFNKLQSILERNMYWLLHREKNIINIDKIIHYYNTGFNVLHKKLKDIMTVTMCIEYKKDLEQFSSNKEAAGVAKEVLMLQPLNSLFDIVEVSKQINKKIDLVAKTYFNLSEQLHFTWLLIQANSFIPRQYFQVTALRFLINQLYEIHMQLAKKHVLSVKVKQSKIESHQKNIIEKYDKYINELKSGDSLDAFISKLTIAVKMIKELTH